MIPGGASHTTLEKIGYLDDIANNPAQPETLRAEAAAGLERIEAGEPVHPIYQAIRDADASARERREAELHARAEAAVAQAKSIKKGKRTPPRRLPLVTDDGQTVVITTPGLYLAVFDLRPLSTFTGLAPDVGTWMVGGHSLGG